MLAVVLTMMAGMSASKTASGGTDGLPFNGTVTNVAPLFFGMDALDAARALGVPLIYVQGRPGNETFFAMRDDGGSGFFPRDDRIYLQFRRGRLTGIKGDWGRNWMWR